MALSMTAQRVVRASGLLLIYGALFAIFDT